MARNQQTNRAYAVLATVAALMAAAPVAAASTPCDEVMNRIWSIKDATSFEAIESQIHVLVVNSRDELREALVSFPNEEGC